MLMHLSLFLHFSHPLFTSSHTSSSTRHSPFLDFSTSRLYSCPSQIHFNLIHFSLLQMKTPFFWILSAFQSIPIWMLLKNAWIFHYLVPRMVTINVMCFGNLIHLIICSHNICTQRIMFSNNFFEHFSFHIFFLPRCRLMGDAYEKIFSNPNSEVSQICNKTINDLTTMIANFVKYG